MCVKHACPENIFFPSNLSTTMAKTKQRNSLQISILLKICCWSQVAAKKTMGFREFEYSEVGQSPSWNVFKPSDHLQKRYLTYCLGFSTKLCFPW